MTQPQNVLNSLRSRKLTFSRKSSNEFFIFARDHFSEEIYFTYFTRIKFSEFLKKDILPAAVTFCIRLKKPFTRLARDLVCTIQKLKIFTGVKFPELCELAVY